MISFIFGYLRWQKFSAEKLEAENDYWLAITRYIFRIILIKLNKKLFKIFFIFVLRKLSKISTIKYISRKKLHRIPEIGENIEVTVKQKLI